MSWGASEFSGETAYDDYFQTPAGTPGRNLYCFRGRRWRPTGRVARRFPQRLVGGRNHAPDHQFGRLTKAKPPGVTAAADRVLTKLNRPTSKSRRTAATARRPTWPTTPIPTPVCLSTIRSTTKATSAGRKSAAPALVHRSGGLWSPLPTRHAQGGGSSLDGESTTMKILYAQYSARGRRDIRRIPPISTTLPPAAVGVGGRTAAAAQLPGMIW